MASEYLLDAYTEGKPFRSFSEGWVTPHGFEPQFLRSERNVLPLDDGVLIKERNVLFYPAVVLSLPKDIDGPLDLSTVALAKVDDGVILPLFYQFLFKTNTQPYLRLSNFLLSSTSSLQPVTANLSSHHWRLAIVR